jgi:hypothetical protein
MLRGSPTVVKTGKLSRLSRQDDIPVERLFLSKQAVFLSQPTLARCSGTHRLLRAVLLDAIADWFRYRHACTTRGRRLFQETHAWFWSQETSWLYAFESICEYLTLNSDSIRQGLTLSDTVSPQTRKVVFCKTPVTVASRLDDSRHGQDTVRVHRKQSCDRREREPRPNLQRSLAHVG